MASKKQPSQVVLVRREIDKVIDQVADEIAKRRGNRDRSRIAVFGGILSALSEPLHEVKRLQCAGHTEIPSKLREEILKTGWAFGTTLLRENFEKIKILL